MFVQNLWKYKYDWNEKLSDELINQWNLITDEWSKVTLEVPRRIVEYCVERFELHAFSDAAKGHAA